jgi:PmbA protein
MDTGFLVSSVIGQGVNMVTGDYSRGANGFWVEGGKIVHAVEEVTIAANLKDMYQGIRAIANDTENRGSVFVGSILINEMKIAGK